MRTRLIALVLLLAGASSAQSLGGGAGRSLGDAVGGQGLLTGGRHSEFELLVAGAGQPNFISNADFFTTNASEFTGNWWGFSGATGAAVSGSGYAFSAQGSPFAQSLRTCNNGLDCALTTARRLDADADFYQATTNATAPPGDFSVCFLGSYDRKSATSSSTDLVMLWDHDTVAENSIYFTLDEGGTLYFGVWNGTSETFLTSTNPIAKRQEQFLCATYDWVASGSSVARLYVDGVLASAVKSNMVGPAKATSATPWIIGSRKDITTRHLEGRVRLAFVTEKLLSAATLLSMSNSLAGIGLVASTGATLSSSIRASPATCTNDAWATMTIVGNNRPCVSAGGIEAMPPSTNLLLWSDALDDAAWVDIGTPVGGQADVPGVYAADGSPTADQIGDDSAAAFEGKSQTVATTSQTKFTWSGWLRQGASAAIDKVTVRITGTGNAAGDTTCTFTGLTTTLTRKKCATTAAYGAGITALTADVLAGTVVADIGNFIVTGQHLETGGAMMPYIRTESVAVARIFYQLGLDTPASITDTQGCVRATFFAHDEQPNSNANAVVSSNTGGLFIRVDPVIPTRGSTFDGLNGIGTGVLTSLIGRSVDFLSTWSTATNRLTIEEVGLAVAASGAYDGTVIGSSPIIRLGRSGGSSDPSFGRISNIRVGATTGSCR